MSADQQDRARQALGFLVHTLRPDWDTKGIHTAIDRLHRDREPLGVIARAAVAAALTSSTRTPGGIAARIRDGWTGDEKTQPSTPMPDSVERLTCPRCGRLTPRGSAHDRAACRPSAETDYSRGAAAARAAIRPGPVPTEETP